ncbi:hypothetical protein GUJ93_ZPchr0013g34657 [Zizania palustris]|uniref:Uncharacterized protein n=1 Tax=Zizania palustris TaxID=103762 RepID=A0A8J5WT38_ZIZPA|nr:hypothetical protein GUJ93_ZPchr0013g34657 [Zizania palustris]
MQKCSPVLTSLTFASSALAKSSSEELRAAVGGGRGGTSGMVACVRGFGDRARAETIARRGFRGGSSGLWRLRVLPMRLSRR